MKNFHVRADRRIVHVGLRLTISEAEQIASLATVLQTDKSSLLRWLMLQSLQRLTAIASSKAAANGK